MVAYATQSDVYKYGLPRGALGNPGRLVSDFTAPGTTLELVEHGFSLNDAVTFRASQGGALPAPLVAGTVYYAIPVTDSTFEVSATSGGSAVSLTTNGTSVIVTADLPWADVLEAYSRFVDGFVPAHAVPLTAPYPITVVMIVAELAAKKLQILSGMRSGSMDEAEQGAAAQLKRWAAGLPVRDAAPGQPAANLAVVKADRREDVIGRGCGFGFWGPGESRE